MKTRPKMEAKHNAHEKLKHPMTKDQLEDVWEEQDHMDPQDWDPKTFFNMHDLDGNGQWDENEVRVLFKKELDKAYDPNAPEDDMREREEEMERMREHVFKESDSNKDRLISFDEFLAETKRDEFDEDPGWETMDMAEDDNEIFSDEEFRAYQAQRDREIQGMLNKGQVPPGYPYYGNVPPGAQPYQIPPHMGAQMGGVPGSIPGQAAFRPEQGYPQQPGLGHPQQFAQHPQMGQPPMGHPQMGQPQMGQPQMAHPQMGQPQMGQPNMGQPQMRQPQMGQPQMGQPQMGQPQVGQPQVGQPQVGQPQVGQPQMGQPQMGQPQGVQPPVGQPQVGQPQPSMGQKPLPVGQPQPSM